MSYLLRLSFLGVGFCSLVLGTGCSKSNSPEAPPTPSEVPAEHPPTDDVGSESESPADTGRRAKCAPEDKDCQAAYSIGGEKVCGGFAGDTCTATEYCAYQAGQYCGAADASATCKQRPEMCTEQYQPVCGCDNKTHGNTCMAALAGVGVLTEGECPPEQK